MRQTLEKQLKNGRINLFLALVFTVLDIVLIITESTYSFPFSVYFPQVVVSILKYLNLGTTGTIIGIAAIAICLGAYFLFAILADKHFGFLVGALVLFSVDTIFVLVFAFTAGDMIVDVLFHLWVLAYLIMGVRAGVKLAKLPPEPVMAQPEVSGTIPINGVAVMSETPAAALNTKPLRTANEKGRIIISTDYNGMRISIKRSFALTELIVNGYVYGEQKGLVEMPYFFEVYVMNTRIGCQLTQNIGTMKMAILIDGREIAFKNRIV